MQMWKQLNESKTKFSNYCDRLLDSQLLRVLVIILPPIYFGIYHDVFRSYLTTSDMDVVVAHHSLLFNDGLPQTHYDHNGYVNFVLNFIFLKVLSWLQLIGNVSLNHIITGVDPESAFAQLVYVGRWYSIILSGATSLVFYKILAQLTNDRHLSLAGALLFSTSYGLISHTLISRPELLSMTFALLAFMFSLKSIEDYHMIGRSTRNVFVAGCMTMLAMMTKLQVIFPLLFMPFVTLIMGKPAAIDTFGMPSRYYDLNRILMVALLATIISPILWFFSIYFHNTEVWHEPYSEIVGWYQVAIILYVFAVLGIYKWHYHLSRDGWLMAQFLLFCGILLPTYLYFLFFLEQNFVSTVNFYDWLRVYTNPDIRFAEGNSVSAIVKKVMSEIPNMGKRYLSVDSMMRSPHVLMQVTAFLMALYLLGVKQYKVALAISSLLLVSLGCEVSTSLRYIAARYFIYFEPWTIVAFVLGIHGVLRKKNAKWVGLSYMFIMLLITQNVYLQHSGELVPKQADSNACVFAPVETYPFLKKYCP